MGSHAPMRACAPEARNSPTCKARAICIADRDRISMTGTPCCTGLAKSGIMPPMKSWEIVADKLSAAGWSWGYCSAVTKDGWRWIVDAHREGRRYIVHSDECVRSFKSL